LEEAFTIVPSGLSQFLGMKNYVDTSNVEVNELVGEPQNVRFLSRPSRANMEAQINDVLFAKMANTRKVLLIGQDTMSNIYSTGFFVLRPNQLVVRPKYLYYWVRWENTELLKDRLAHGETQRQLNSTQLKKKFKIPTPCLTAQDQSIQKFDKVESILKRLRKQKRVAEHLIISEREEQFRTVEKEYLTLQKVCEPPTPYRYPTFYGFEYVKEGIPVLKISNMSLDGKLPTDKSLYDCITDEVNAQFPNTVVQENDLIMEVRGTYIGKTALVPKELAGSNISPNTIRISLDTDRIIPAYFWHYTFTSWWQNQIERITRRWKQGFGTVRADRLKVVRIPAPLKDTQNQVLSKLEAIDDLLVQFSRNIITCEELLQTFLQKVF